ncbi:hypothetical protein ACERNI_11675 [Camelimonas sp. ID_303_24]
MPALHKPALYHLVWLTGCLAALSAPQARASASTGQVRNLECSGQAASACRGSRHNLENYNVCFKIEYAACMQSMR